MVTVFFAIFLAALYLTLLIYFSSFVLLSIRAAYASYFSLPFSCTSSFHHQIPFILPQPPLKISKISLADLRIHTALYFHIVSACSTCFQLPSTLFFSGNLVVLLLVRIYHLTIGSLTLFFSIFKLLITISITKSL